MAENEIVDENESDEDDREAYAGLLADMAFFSLKSLDKFMDFTIRFVIASYCLLY